LLTLGQPLTLGNKNKKAFGFIGNNYRIRERRKEI
jgi:hypothetical protein